MKKINWRYWLLPSIVLLVFFSQLILNHNGLSRWRGGGFGMYTETHFNYRQIWINDSLLPMPQGTKDNSLSLQIRNVKAFPTTFTISQLRKSLELKEDDKIEIWTPMINPVDFSFYRKLIYSTDEQH